MFVAVCVLWACPLYLYLCVVVCVCVFVSLCIHFCVFFQAFVSLCVCVVVRVYSMSLLVCVGGCGQSAKCFERLFAVRTETDSRLPGAGK